MYRYIFLILAIFFSNVAYCAEVSDSKKQKFKANLEMSNAQFFGTYVLKDGEVIMLLSGSKHEYMMSKKSEMLEFKLEDALNAVNISIDRVKGIVCKGKLRPESVTITVPLLSATWSTEDLCK